MGAVDISEKQIKEIETKLFIAAMENMREVFSELTESYADYVKYCRSIGRLSMGATYNDLRLKAIAMLAAIDWNVGVDITMTEVVSVLQKNIEEMDAEARKMHEDEGRQSMAFAMEGPGPDAE